MTENNNVHSSIQSRQFNTFKSLWILAEIRIFALGAFVHEAFVCAPCAAKRASAIDCHFSHLNSEHASSRLFCFVHLSIDIETTRRIPVNSLRSSNWFKSYDHFNLAENGRRKIIFSFLKDMYRLSRIF